MKEEGFVKAGIRWYSEGFVKAKEIIARDEERRLFAERLKKRFDKRFPLLSIISRDALFREIDEELKK
jgi:hypothetical protein